MGKTPPRTFRLAAAALALLLGATSGQAKDSIFAIAEPGPRLYRVDLADGNREIVSGQIVSGVSTAFVRRRGRGESLAYEQDSQGVFVVSGDGARPVALTGRGLGFDENFDYAAVGIVHDLASNADGRIFATVHLSLGRGPALIEIDRATGDRRLVTGGGENRPPPGIFFEAAAEGTSSVVLHNCLDRATVLRVDVETGEREVVSGRAPTAPFGLVGGGPELLAMNAIDVAPDGSIYVVGYRGLEVDGVVPSVVRVDPATGDRTTISNSFVGSGPDVFFDVAVVDDATLIAAGDNGLVLLVDVATGDRSIISGGGVGAGPELFRADSVDYDPADGLAYAYDYNLKEMVSIDLATGDRTRVWNNDLGSGPALGGATNRFGLVAMAEESPGVLLGLGERQEGAEPATTFLMRVDVRDGTRFIVADPTTGAGPVVGVPGDLVLLDDGMILLSDAVEEEEGQPLVGRLLLVDPATGDRTLFSQPGADIRRSHDLELDPARGVAYLAERLRLLRVDLATGESVVVAEDPLGNGEVLALESICLAADGFLYAQHLVPEVTFLRFDPDTWQRETVLVQPGLVFPSSLSDLDAGFAGRPIYKGPNSRLWRMILPDGTTRDYGVPLTATAFQPALNRAAAFLVADDGVPVPGFALAIR